MRVKYFVQEHNAVPWPVLKPRLLNLESRELTIRLRCLLLLISIILDFGVILFSQLESLPKEDLIKYVKKQVALLKQSKAKCEGITNLQ